MAQRWLTAASKTAPASPMEHRDGDGGRHGGDGDGTGFKAPPPLSPEEEDASFHYVVFDVVWMVQVDRNPWSPQFPWAQEFQWVQLIPKKVEKRLEEMYLDESKGNEDFVP